jgi:hypothetical protein
VQRPLVQHGGRLHLDDGSGIHDSGPITNRSGQFEIMCDEQQGEAAISPHIVKQRHYIGLRRDVKRCRRLVGDQQLRFDEKRRGDHDPLKQSARHLVRILGQPCARRCDANRLENLYRSPVRHVLLDAAFSH